MSDPGWWGSLSAAWRHLIPFVGRRLSARASAAAPRIARSRAAWMAASAGIAYFAIPSLWVDPATTEPPLLPAGWVWAGQLLFVAYGLGAAWFFRRLMLRKLAATATVAVEEEDEVDDGADQIAGMYATSQLVIAALWSAMTALAVVATYMAGDPAHTVVGLLIAAVSAPLLAPTDRRLRAEEHHLRTAGVAWSLRQVLYDTPAAGGPAGPQLA
jgi:hypothetical protein